MSTHTWLLCQRFGYGSSVDEKRFGSFDVLGKSYYYLLRYILLLGGGIIVMMDCIRSGSTARMSFVHIHTHTTTIREEGCIFTADFFSLHCMHRLDNSDAIMGSKE